MNIRTAPGRSVGGWGWGLVLLIAALCGLFTDRAAAQSIDWNSTDCGGNTAPISGGGFTLVGTIGQFDSTGGGAAALSGGSTRLVGGFWAVIPTCPADFNGSGVVSVQDIFDFLAAYFSSDPRADFNYSGTISVQDIFDFLAAYFTGCP